MHFKFSFKQLRRRIFGGAASLYLQFSNKVTWRDWCWKWCPFPKSLAALLAPPANPHSLLLQGTAVGWRSGVCFAAGGSDVACGQAVCWGECRCVLTKIHLYLSLETWQSSSTKC